MNQKATAMGNWRLAALSQQLACSCYYHVRSFFVNIKSPRWLSPPTAQIWCPATSGFFQKLKSPLKGKRFQTVNKIQESMMGQLMAIDRTVQLGIIARCLLWRGLKCHCPMYNVPCIFFNKCLCISYYMAGYLLDRPCIYKMGTFIAISYYQEAH